MPPALFNVPVNVYRRTSQGRDALNNPIYGEPTTGSGWAIVYTGMQAKLAFSSKQIQYAQTGQRPVPSGVMYYGSGYTLQAEDNIYTNDGIQYIVVSVVPAYIVAAVVDHYEAVLSLP